jgi:hypothetical protein
MPKNSKGSRNHEFFVELSVSKTYLTPQKTPKLCSE